MYAFKIAAVIATTAVSPIALADQLTDHKEAFVELCEAPDSSPALRQTFIGLRNIEWDRIGGTCAELYDALVNREEVVLQGGTFQRTDVGDLLPLSHLPNIKTLSLAGQTRITSLAPLAELQLLELDLEEITASLEPLRSSLTLRTLTVTGWNQSLEPLSALLIEKLQVTVPKDVDLQPLASISTLTDLKLGHRFSGPLEGLISNLNFLTSLRSLSIYNYDVDLAGISQLHLTNLEIQGLSIGGNRVLNTNELRAMTTLEVLALRNLNLVNAWFLNQLVNIRDVDLTENELVRFDVSNELPLLRRLVVSKNHMELIYSLNAPNLEELDLSGNRMSSTYWSYFPSYQNLRKLNLSDNRVYHLRGLNLPNLQDLQAAENVIPPENQICIAAVSCDFSEQHL